jgi:hypothetical protein
LKEIVPPELLARMFAGLAILGNILIWTFANTQFDEIDEEKAKKEIDRLNFQKFLELMPPGGLIDTFENHWFEKRFPTKIVHEYDEFNSFYNQPGKTFLDEELENDINEFRLKLDLSFEKITGYTSSEKNGESGFPTEMIMYEEERFRERAKEINELTKDAAQEYRKLVDKWASFFSIPHC